MRWALVGDGHACDFTREMTDMALVSMESGRADNTATAAVIITTG